MDDEPGEALVLDASAIVELLLDAPATEPIRRRMRGNELHAPSHFDAEVLSALGRMHRGGQLSADDVSARLELLQDLPIHRHQLPQLLTGAWDRRGLRRLIKDDELVAAVEHDWTAAPLSPKRTANAGLRHIRIVQN